MDDQVIHETIQIEEFPPANTTGEVGNEDRHRRRSLFGPMLLIGAGILLLLANVGVLGAFDAGFVVMLWPVLLIGLGLDIMVGRRSAALSGLISLGTIGILMVLVMFGPALGIAPRESIPVQFGAGDITSERFIAPLEGAEVATVNLNLSRFPTTIGTAETGALVEADISYFGNVNFDVTGDRDRFVGLNTSFTGIMFGEPEIDSSRYPWTIGLAAGIPIDLTIDGGSGQQTLNLGDLTLTAFTMDSGSGSVQATLPPGEYPLSFDMGSGSVTLILPGNSAFDLVLDTGSGSSTLEVGEGTSLFAQVDSGSGSVNFNLPNDAAIRLELLDSGSGSLNVADNMVRVEDHGDGAGVWETPDFSEAAIQINLVIKDQGSGSINLRNNQ